MRKEMSFSIAHASFLPGVVYRHPHFIVHYAVLSSGKKGVEQWVRLKN